MEKMNTSNPKPIWYAYPLEEQHVSLPGPSRSPKARAPRLTASRPIASQEKQVHRKTPELPCDIIFSAENSCMENNISDAFKVILLETGSEVTWPISVVPYPTLYHHSTKQFWTCPTASSHSRSRSMASALPLTKRLDMLLRISFPPWKSMGYNWYNWSISYVTTGFGNNMQCDV